MHASVPERQNYTETSDSERSEGSGGQGLKRVYAKRMAVADDVLSVSLPSRASLRESYRRPHRLVSLEVYRDLDVQFTRDSILRPTQAIIGMRGRLVL